MAAVFLILLLLFELTPFYWVVITAFKTTQQWTSFESVFWPRSVVAGTIPHPVRPDAQLRALVRNTVMVALVSTVVAVATASLGAYGLTRLRWKGSNVFSSLILVAYLMPVILLFIPMYQILAKRRYSMSCSA